MSVTEKLLFGDGVFAEGFLVAFEVQPGVFQQRRVTCQLSFCLSQCGPVWPGVNFDQGIALVDRLPFSAKMHIYTSRVHMTYAH